MSAFPTLPFPEDRPPRRVWTVSELVEDARYSLEDTYPRIWVRGELGSFRDVRGTWYFDLKDDGAILHVVMFGGDNFRVPFRPEEGLEVVAGGRLSIFGRQGRFQLIAAELDTVGRGSQQLAYEQLRRKLEAEGLFARERKRPVPQLPRCIGVVTSAQGAAWRDLVRVWNRRRTGLRVLLSPCRVQGDGAGREIAAAIRLLDAHGAAEVVIVGRGGGSRDDLWAFNDEQVARAIAASGAPVISAVGHEIDWTIADLVADLRAATPTEAAELVARARIDLLDRTDNAHRRCRDGLRRRLHACRARLEHRDLHRRLGSPERALQAYRQRLDEAGQALVRAGGDRTDVRRRRLDRAADVLARHSPERRAAASRARLDRAAARLRAAATGHLHRGRERRGATAARLEALNPLSVLARGFAVCHAENGAVVRTAAGVERGDRVHVRLHAGRLDCRVETATEERPDEFVDPEGRC